jgi:hypothetical protein
MEGASQRSDLKRFDAAQGPSIGARFMAWTEETGGGFSLVEHPMPPRRLAGRCASNAPLASPEEPISAVSEESGKEGNPRSQAA